MKKNFFAKFGRTFAVVLATSIMTSVPVFAAQSFDPEFYGYTEKDKFWHTTYKIGFGIGEYRPGGAANFNMNDYFFEYELPFGYVPGCVYNAVSSNPSVATAAIDGHGVQLDGKSVGTTVITLQKKVNGKWVNLDTAKVTIEGSSVVTDGIHAPVFTNFTLPIGSSSSPFKISDVNPYAKYTFNVDKPGLTIYECEPNPITHCTGLYCDATIPGIYNVTAVETLNGISKELYKCSIQVKPLTINNKVTVSMSDVFSTNADKYVNNARNDSVYLFKMSDGTGCEVGFVNFQNTTPLIEYTFKYGNPTKCGIITSDGILEGFTKTGTCKVDIYEMPVSSPVLYTWNYETMPEDATYVGSTEITVLP